MVLVTMTPPSGPHGKVLMTGECSSAKNGTAASGSPAVSPVTVPLPMQPVGGTAAPSPLQPTAASTGGPAPVTFAVPCSSVFGRRVTTSIESIKITTVGGN